jgi:hypothetical protein
MARKRRTRGRRGLVVTALLLLGFLTVLDLAGPRSVLRSAWHGVMGPEGAPIEPILRGVGILRR